MISNLGLEKPKYQEGGATWYVFFRGGNKLAVRLFDANNKVVRQNKISFFMNSFGYYKESAIFWEKGYCQFDTFLFIFTAEILK